VKDGLGALREQKHSRLAQHARRAHAICQAAADQVVLHRDAERSARIPRSLEKRGVELRQTDRRSSGLGALDDPLILDGVDLLLGNCEVVSLIRYGYPSP
jgi:hypothetical protein